MATDYLLSYNYITLTLDISQDKTLLPSGRTFDVRHPSPIRAHISDAFPMNDTHLGCIRMFIEARIHAPLPRRLQRIFIQARIFASTRLHIILVFPRACTRPHDASSLFRGVHATVFFHVSAPGCSAASPEYPRLILHNPLLH